MPMVDQKFARPPPVTVPRTFATIEARQKAETPSLVVAKIKIFKGLEGRDAKGNVVSLPLLLASSIQRT